MCGLVGTLSSTLSALDAKIFEDLMMISCLRGVSGAGITVVPSKEKKGIKVVKTRMTGLDLLWEKEYTKFDKTEKTCLVGHTRYRTRGGNTINDIHPHEVGPIILSHNGTMEEIDNYVCKKNENDSRILAGKLSTKSLREFMPATLGPCAMVWVDKSDETIHFYRNEGRSLFFAYNATGPDTIYWASELGFLHLALKRNTFNTDFKYVGLPPNSHWVFPVRPDEYQYIKLKSSEVVISKKPPAPPVNPADVATAVQAARDAGTSVIHLPAQRTASGVPVVLPRSYAPAMHVNPQDHSLNTYQTKDGCYIYKSELEQAFRAGCYNCKCHGTWQDYSSGQMHWFHESRFMCTSCYANDINAKNFADATLSGRAML